MVMAVAGDLVATRRDLPGDLGVVADRHPEHEEGRPRPKLVEELEDRRHLALEGVPGSLPPLDPQPAFDQLVVVLEIEAEQQHRPRLDALVGRGTIAQLARLSGL